MRTFPLLVIALLLAYAPWLWAQNAKEPNAFESHAALAQAVQDLMLDLGPMLPSLSARPAQFQKPLQPPSAPVPAEGPRTLEREMALANTTTASAPEPVIPDNIVLTHQDFHFWGTQPWEDQSLTLFKTARGFELNIKSPFPVNLWKLYTANGSFVAAGRTANLSSFYFFIEEAYQAPYILVLYVNYQDVFYKVKVMLE